MTVREVYEKTGRVVHLSSMLNYHLAFIASLLKAGGKIAETGCQPDPDELVNDVSEDFDCFKTKHLGTLLGTIRTLEERFPLPVAISPSRLTHEISGAIKKRNHVIHHMLLRRDFSDEDPRIPKMLEVADEAVEAMETTVRDVESLLKRSRDFHPVEPRE